VERFRRGPCILYVFSSRAYRMWPFNMRDAAMGTTADKIARNVAARARAPVADLAAHRSARQLCKEAQIDHDDFERRIANGLDPCFAVYAHAQAMVSIGAEHLSTTKEARQFARIVGEAEDAYMPSYPPMSPVTTSHFAMWSLFDVQFGQSRETIGTCFLRIAELTEMPVELRTTVAALQASRLGIYVHCGHEGRFVRLREIGTETAVLCLVPAGYRGDVGEVWLARLLPPGSRAIRISRGRNDAIHRSRRGRGSMACASRAGAAAGRLENPRAQDECDQLHHEAWPQCQPLERVHLLCLRRALQRGGVPDRYSGYRGKSTARVSGKEHRGKFLLRFMRQEAIMDEHSILAAFSQAGGDLPRAACARRQPTVRGLRRASSR
jgi:hypothetical protein